MEIAFSVPGEPVAKQRPRLGRNNNTYTPDRTRQAEQTIAWAYKAAAQADGIAARSDTLIELAAVFLYAKRDKDIDNMLKTVLDGLNDIAWDDDKQVVRVMGYKVQVPADQAGTHVIVKQYDHTSTQKVTDAQ